MPRPPAAVVYQDQIAAWQADGLKPGAIFRRIEAWAREHERDDYPTERSVYRIAAKIAKWPEHERRASGLLRWPESFELGLLPWDAARVALDLLRAWNSTGQQGLTVRVARWYWRVLLADPTIARGAAASLAAALAANEVAALTGSPPVVVARRVELLLAYQTGRSDRDKAAHEAAANAAAESLGVADDWNPPVSVEFYRGLWGDAAAVELERALDGDTEAMTRFLAKQREELEEAKNGQAGE